MNSLSPNKMRFITLSEEAIAVALQLATGRVLSKSVPIKNPENLAISLLMAAFYGPKDINWSANQISRAYDYFPSIDSSASTIYIDIYRPSYLVSSL